MDLPSGKLTELRTGKWTIFLDDLPLQHPQFFVDFPFSYTVAWFEGKPWLRGEAAGEA